MNVDRRLGDVPARLRSVFDVIVNGPSDGCLMLQGIDSRTNCSCPFTVAETSWTAESHPAGFEVAAEDFPVLSDEEDLELGMVSWIESLPNFFGTEHEGLH